MDESTVQRGALELEIRPRKSWRLISNFLVMGIWSAYLYASLVGFRTRVQIGRSTSEALGIVAFALAGAIWASYVLLKALFLKEIVSVDLVRLTIQRKLLLLEFGEAQYDNPSISNLRCEEWSAGHGGTRTAIRFEHNGQTITFAREAGASASWDLIDRIRTVYPFPTPEVQRSPAVTSW
jgi:hypothetical protein